MDECSIDKEILYGVSFVLYTLLEFYLGKEKRIKPNSVIEAIVIGMIYMTTMIVVKLKRGTHGISKRS